MSKKDSSPQLSSTQEALQGLRTRAEESRKLVTQTVDNKSPEEVLRLVQELQVHQIELQMQYEQLLLAQAEAETVRAQYVDLYDFAPVGYFLLNSQGMIQQLNLAGSQLFGTVRQRLQGRRFLLFVGPDYREGFRQFLELILTADHRQTCELELHRDDGTPFFAQLEGVAVPALPGADGLTLQCRLAIIDTTARHTAAAALATSEAKFRQLFEQSSDGILLVQNSRFIDCNQAALNLLGAQQKDQVVGHEVWLRTPEVQPDGQRTADLFRSTVADAQRLGSKRCVALMHHFDGRQIWMEAVLTSISVGAQVLVHVVWRDVTAERQSAEQLRTEKEFTESLLNNSVDGVFAFDTEYRCTAWNRVMEEYSGVKVSEILGRPLFEVFPNHRDSAEGEAVRQVLTGQALTRYDLRFYRHQGHFETHMVPLRDRSGGLVLVRDVTERTNRAEETTQLKLRQQQEVLSAILTTQEEERKRIAEALHNGVGQLLYATKLNLENRGGAPAGQRDAVMSLLDEAIKATRTISFELTPGILEDFGLKIALEELCKRIPKQNLHIHMQLLGLEQPRPRPLDVAIYRIVQELLNNIIKHAQAQEAFVHVVHEEGRVSISVEDDGVGFDPDLGTSRLNGIGLAGIRNRVDLVGGTLILDSRRGRGTIVSIELGV